MNPLGDQSYVVVVNPSQIASSIASALLRMKVVSPTGADIIVNDRLRVWNGQDIAPYREIVRPGRAFYVNTTAAVAAAVAIPTTGHMLSLFNNEPDGGLSYVIDWVGVSGVAKTAAAGQQQILCNIGQARETTPADAGLTIKKLNGNGGVANVTNARTILTGTALPAGTGVAANWFPMGPSFGSPGAAATPGHGAWVPIDGRIIVPPGRYFAMHVLADVVGSTYQAFIAWHEAQLALG